MVNVNEYEPRGLTQEEIWTDAFETSIRFLQREPKFCEFHGNPWVLMLDCFKCQQFIKELSYRIFEELCEAGDACSASHAKEELADAAIFTNLLVGLLGRKLTTWPAKLNSWEVGASSEVFLKLGMFTNCLKLRPWRKQFTPIDVNVLNTRLDEFLHRFNIFLTYSFDNLDDFMEIVDKKTQVNQFRLRSNY